MVLVGPPSEDIRWGDRRRGLMVHTAQAGFVPQLQLLKERRHLFHLHGASKVAQC